jgi:hypothetical protein
MPTVDDIQSRVAAVVDQDNDTSNISSADYALRLNFLNRRERTWSESGRYQVLFKRFNASTSQSTGNVTVSLPSDFRELSSFPDITYDGQNTELFPEIQGQDEGQFLDSDRYVEIIGNSFDGYSMIVNPGTDNGFMASGASIKVPYYAVPTSHASPANNVTCPNPEYLVYGVIEDVFMAREDARSELARFKAETILANMLEKETTPSVAAYDNEVKTVEQTRFAFRIGRD